mgnify:CR=1 FL=1
MSAIDIVLVVIALVAVGVAVACALQLKSLRAELRERGDSSAETLAALEQANNALDALNVALAETRRTANAIAQQQTTDAAVEQQRYLTIAREFSQAGDRMDDLRRETAQQLGANREGIEHRLDKVRETVDAQLGAIRKDNNVQLDQMRATVDEKLSRTLNDRLSASFKQVSDQLEAVYKGLGDMQSIATGVGDLKRVLGNVKARGILGEVQLGAILADILTPDQYLENVATKPGASERVEFAVKLPVDEGDPVLLPIDSKFPGDAYEHLLDAQESGDAEAVAAARKTLDTMVKREAKDICEKYLSVPATTNFGILFVPFEGLYAEVVSRPGLIETLGRDYHVNVAGPSTMAAILNSLQMSYQTFKLQKRTDDVLRVLSAVKAELPRYQKALRRAQQQIETAGKTVEGIITTRTNVMERKLKDIDALEDAEEADEILGLTSAELLADQKRRGLIASDGGAPAQARRGRFSHRACLKCTLVCNNGVSPYQTRKEAHVSEKHQPAQPLHRAPHAAAVLGCHAHAAADCLSLGVLVGGRHLFADVCQYLCDGPHCRPRSSRSRGG